MATSANTGRVWSSTGCDRDKADADKDEFTSLDQYRLDDRGKKLKSDGEKNDSKISEDEEVMVL